MKQKETLGEAAEGLGLLSPEKKRSAVPGDGLNPHIAAAQPAAVEPGCILM